MNTVKRYDLVMVRADEFRAVVRAVIEHPDLPAPDGVGASRLSWRKQIGETVHMAWITRVASVLEGVTLAVGFWTPDMHPQLANHGKHTFNEILQSASDPGLDEAVTRFAHHWRNATKEPSPGDRVDERVV